MNLLEDEGSEVRGYSVDDVDRILSDISDDVMVGLVSRLQERMIITPVPVIADLYMMVTHRCNLACDYCFISAVNHALDMPTEVARTALERVLAWSTDSSTMNVTLFGGEPLLRKGFMIETLAYAKELCNRAGKTLSVACTTNGLLIDDEALDISAQYGFNYLLSLDGVGWVHDLHRKTKSGEGTFDRIAAKLPYIKSRQPWLGARMTITPESVRYLADGVRRLFDMGINQFILGPAFEADWQPEDLEEMRTQYTEVLGFYYSAAKERGLPMRIVLMESRVNAGRDCWGCGAGSHTICVDAVGDVYPCARLQTRQSYRMGNIMRGPLNWQAGMRISGGCTELRWKCMKCEYADSCLGGCYASNMDATGSPYYPPESTCMFARTIAECMKQTPGLAELLSPEPSQVGQTSPEP